MGLLAKVSPATANVDTLIYAVPPGKKASVTLNVSNRGLSAVAASLAIMSDVDTSVDSIAVLTKGSGYLAIPSLTFSGECSSLASGVVNSMTLASLAVEVAGEGYAVDDILNLVVTDGDSSVTATARVLAVSGTGGITSASVENGGVYSAIGLAATVSGGSGVNASFQGLTWGINQVTIQSKGNGYKTNPVVSAAGGLDATFTTQMTRIVESDDYFEPDVAILTSAPLERTGLVLSEGQSLYIKAGAPSVLNAHVWGFETLA